MRKISRFARRFVYASGMLASLWSAQDARAKLGETLPQLIKRFGNAYTTTGAESDGTLTYEFRSATYSLDAMMSRQNDRLVSTVEIYYSDKPLQANGEPPTAIVRGVMNVTAPGAKWHETTPVGIQRAAFVTSDGAFTAAIFPADKSVVENTTFTMAVANLKQGGATLFQLRISGIVGPAVTQTVAPTPTKDSQVSVNDTASTQAADSLAVTLTTGKIVHFQTVEEKQNFEAAIGIHSEYATPSSVAPPSGPPLVVGRLKQNGWDFLKLSDGTIVYPGQLELQSYEQNEIAADQAFKGQRLPIYGTIDSFGTDIFGYPYVILDRGAHAFTGVQCTFSKSDANVLATLRKGQTIALVGKHNGKLFNIQIGECSLIQWGKMEDAPKEVRRATAAPYSN